MKKYRHIPHVVAVHQKEWGMIDPLMVISNCDHGGCIYQTAADQRDKIKLIFGNKVMAEVHYMSDKNIALSPDGKKLALCNMDSEQKYVVSINGEVKYEVLSDSVYSIEWLDNERLVWQGWNKYESNHDAKGTRYFLDGKDVTGTLRMEHFLDERMTRMVAVEEDGIQYVIRADGSVSEKVPAGANVPQDHSFDEWNSTLFNRKNNAAPRTYCNEDLDKIEIIFDQAGTLQFDTIGYNHGVHFMFNNDGSKVACIGIRYSPLARKVGIFINKALRDMDESKWWNHLWGWPAALLFNPYFGPGHILVELTKRWYPVNNGHVWQKGYMFAYDHFYTSLDQLAVQVQEGQKWRVVIDEDEGPLFDRVYNPRCLDRNGPKLFYLGLSSDTFYQVEVPLA
ncbi:MAG: hypothetical protein HYT37_01970 [Candidatus Sungbacteria bacterium]|nr:hypothetical protein [Candidatus Sungbacteria bacterium]